MNIIEIQNVSKFYASHTALYQVSLSIPKGCIFGLLGPNGAGKTSLIRILTQIHIPDEGKVLFNERPLQPEDVKSMGYLPEERGLYKKMKIGEQLLYLAQLKGVSKKEAVRKIDYWLDKLTLTEWKNKHVEDLSKGMQQKVQFIATVLHEPEVIILDEPFSGFDPVNAQIIRDEILELKAKGHTVILSTHRMESVEALCDYMALINKSHKILDGKTKEIKHAYKDSLYLIKTAVPVNLDDTYFNEVDYKESDGQHSYTVELLSGDTNTLLSSVMSQAPVLHFEEVIPSIHDIFIKEISQVNEQTDTLIN